MDNFITRKNPRLKEYDYSQSGYYFITICCKDKKNHLGKIPHTSWDTPNPYVVLSDMGKTALAQWSELENTYPRIELDQFIIMPNHIHGIIKINDWHASTHPSPTIGNIICSFKSITTKIINKRDNTPGRIIWQRNYYEHIIRDEKELLYTRKYIKYNFLKWEKDKYYN